MRLEDKKTWYITAIVITIVAVIALPVLALVIFLAIVRGKISLGNIVDVLEVNDILEEYFGLSSDGKNLKPVKGKHRYARSKISRYEYKPDPKILEEKNNEKPVIKKKTVDSTKLQFPRKSIWDDRESVIDKMNKK